MDWYVLAVGILFAMAVINLIVGVSNDAVNFLNSSIGSRVAPRATIMIIASLGILTGVTFSSGMIEVARKGIFHPRFFLMPELVTICLAVMITNVLLLDFFNTFGLPTSTTVSIVFELLGAAVAVSIFKISKSGQSLLHLANYINTSKALAIISGILLSVVIAFVCGALVQYLTRLLFTFDYKARLKRYGGLWGAIALSMILYFIIVKGSKGASFLTPEMATWIKTHTWNVIEFAFIIFFVIFQLLVMLTRINILKPIVLIGTFALAMAFAANDLVNFIGVPLAGFQSYVLAQTGPDPTLTSMAGLQKQVPTSTFFLLAAGGIMVATLWLSRKARTVTRTELSLGRQDEGLERFDSTPLSRVIVRISATLIDASSRVFPKSLRQWNRRRMNTDGYQPALGYDGTTPEFDLVRASVNLMLASALISWATSMKLPLSTTYVTFMVAMGTSLADKAWGLESAVYRVTGVLTVIGGWFFTALIAFTTSLAFAFVLAYSKGFGVIPLLGLVVFLIIRNLKIHSRREEAVKDLEFLDLKRVTDASVAVHTSFEHSGRFLSIVRADLSACFDGILKQDRKQLEQLRRQTKKLQTWANIIVANVFKATRLLQQENVESAGNYIAVIAALQEITESLRDMILRCHVHTSNLHSRLLPAQRQELEQLRQHVEALLDESAAMLLKKEPYDYQKLATHYGALKKTMDELDQNQVGRIRRGVSKTRLSVLFYGINNASRKISKQTLKLLKTFDQTFQLEDKTDMENTPGKETLPENSN